MIAATRHLQFEHLPCITHSIQRTVTVSLQNSAFDCALSESCKVMGHFKHSPPNTSELEKTASCTWAVPETEPLVQDVPTRWNSTLEMVKRLQRCPSPAQDQCRHANKGRARKAAEPGGIAGDLQKSLEETNLFPVRLYCLHYAICLG
ncbi:hypothetical protein MHYP_G00015850 [Metynnis hypsauchen]